jgi:FixJ family two-component response regulator
VSEAPIIVCVEDDVGVRDAIAGFITALGFVADCFSSAEEFLYSGRLDGASCLIIDVKLTGMSGLELQTRLVEMGCNTPIIVITAFPDERVRAQAISSGAVCFLTKPITRADLVDCIDQALKRRPDGGGVPS